MPGYEQHEKVASQIAGSVKLGTLNVTWKDAMIFEYSRDGKLYRYDVSTKQASEAGEAPADQGFGRGGRGGRGGGSGVARGRQADSTTSPDGTKKAFYRARNLWISDADGANESAITTDGSEKDRIKYGTASWVYGEELSQTTAVWWSPKNDKVAYYRFDESPVPDYYLQLSQT